MKTEVLVVGAGPAGLLLAGELRRAGIDTTVVERDATRPPISRGFSLNARSLDLLARRGLAERFLAEGWQVPHAAFTSLPVRLQLAGTATDHPFSLGIPQTRVEEILEEEALASGVALHRGVEFLSLHQDSEEVTARVRTPEGDRDITARYLVGCDGGRSAVRTAAGIDFPGSPATRFSLLGDVELVDPDSVTTGPNGDVFVLPRPGYVRVITADPNPRPDRTVAVTLEEFQSAVDNALGHALPMRRAHWLTRFGDAARQASQYVRGRVLLAGDAAHIHPPAGSIGINVALADAVNLGWKLAATVHGTAPEELLNSYHVERHRDGADILAGTRAQVLLSEAGERWAPLRALLTRIAEHPAGNRAFAEVLTGLDTRYDMGTGIENPRLGALLSNMDLHTDSGVVELNSLLTSDRGLLIENAEQPGEWSRQAASWSDRVAVRHGRIDGQPDLAALLVRPDGHLAWLVDANGATGSLTDALRRWFGAAMT